MLRRTFLKSLAGLPAVPAAVPAALGLTAPPAARSVPCPSGAASQAGLPPDLVTAAHDTIITRIDEDTVMIFRPYSCFRTGRRVSVPWCCHTGECER
jgi:hypothetical protein